MARIDMEQAFYDRLISTEAEQDEYETAKCSWCGKVRNMKKKMYIITRGESFTPIGFICGGCACSAEQSLILFGEDGSLF